MRGKAMRRELGSRKNIYKILREENHLQPFVDDYGNEIMINPVKHFLKQEPYKNTRMNKVLMDIAQKYASYIKNLEDKNVVEFKKDDVKEAN